jgi:hypothetical protein
MVVCPAIIKGSQPTLKHRLVDCAPVLLAHFGFHTRCAISGGLDFSSLKI